VSIILNAVPSTLAGSLVESHFTDVHTLTVPYSSNWSVKRSLQSAHQYSFFQTAHTYSLFQSPIMPVLSRHTDATNVRNPLSGETPHPPLFKSAITKNGRLFFSMGVVQMFLKVVTSHCTTNRTYEYVWLSHSCGMYRCEVQRVVPGVFEGPQSLHLQGPASYSRLSLSSAAKLW
jgi:hypothetical protein